MILSVDITRIGCTVNKKTGEKFYLSFKENDILLHYVEEFFKTLLSLELSELSFRDLACMNCGVCCKYFSPVEVNHEEIVNMARYLDITVKEFKDRYTAIKGGWPHGGIVIKDVEDEDSKLTGCVFLKKEHDSETHLCSVHPARPAACRAYKPSPLLPVCRNLWKSKEEKINNVTLYPSEMTVYIVNEFPRMEPAMIKYRDVPILMPVVSDIKNYIEQFNLSIIENSMDTKIGEFTCIKCGNCCIFRENIPLTSCDIKSISEFLGTDEEHFIKDHTDIFTDWEGEKIKVRKKTSVKNYEWCNFLRKNDEGTFQCDIYEVCPQACRHFISGSEKRFCQSCKSLGLFY